MIKAESLAGKIRLGEGEINALIRVLESDGEDETVDAFERICASALRQCLIDIEKLNKEILQQRHIIRFNDDEVARLTACEVDASRYRVLRASDARSDEELDAYCDDLILGKKHD